MSARVKLAALLSGGGTTLQNLIDRIEDGRLDAEVVVVGSSRRSAFGLERAKKHGIDTFVCPSKDCAGDSEELSRRIDEKLARYEVGLVVLAGFMCRYHFPEALRHRVMNIHPALIPSFCGKGMYGHLVHEAVLEAGVKVSGCTVHFVDEQYDHGPIIVQRTCPVLDDDTPETLAARVFKEECEAYPEAIRLFGQRRISVTGTRVRVSPA